MHGQAKRRPSRLSPTPRAVFLKGYRHVAAAPARTGSCRAVAALHQKAGPAEEGRDGSWRLRPPGQVRPAGVAHGHAGCITAALIREGSPAARVPGFPRGPRRSRWSRRPINLVVYRPLGAWARGHAPLQVAVRGEVLARSRDLHIGHDHPQVARQRSIITQFRTASSPSGALYRTSSANLPRGSWLWLWRGPGRRPGRGGAVTRRASARFASTAPAGPHPLLALRSSLSARDAVSHELTRVSPSLTAEWTRSGRRVCHALYLAAASPRSDWKTPDYRRDSSMCPSVSVEGLTSGRKIPRAAATIGAGVNVSSKRRPTVIFTTSRDP